MTQPSDASRNTGARTRRGFLSTVGVGLAGTGLVAGTAAGQNETQNGTQTGTAQDDVNQERLKRRVVIPEDERFEDYNQDKFLHVIKSTDVTIDRKEFEQCNFASWSPESTTAYRTQIIDTVQDNPQPVETNAFVNQNISPLPAGSLYVIDTEKQCPGRYLGLEIEFLSGDVPESVTGAEATESPTQTNGNGPGFGVLAALGALGSGVLARTWKRE